METMSIALPALLKELVPMRVAQGGYRSLGEFVREPNRMDPNFCAILRWSTAS